MIQTLVLLGIYPTELKTYVHENTCTQIFMESLFVLAKAEGTKMSSDIWISNCGTCGQWKNIMDEKK